MTRGADVLLLAVSVLLVAVLLVAWRAERLTRLLESRIPARASRILLAVGTSLAPLRSPRRSGGALVLALAKKAAEALAILCVQHAFGVELPISSALLVLAAVNLATMVPLVPGNLGVYEAAVVVGYAYLGVPAERALGIAAMQHACYFVALALPGYRWLARSPAERSSAAAT
jgi:uncharacterized membrane protein YbhN (UPF0104 family)